MKKIQLFIFLIIAIVCSQLTSVDVHAETVIPVSFYCDTSRSLPECYVEKGSIDYVLPSGNDYGMITNYYQLDLTKADGFQIVYKTWLQRCNCAQPNVIRKGRITYSIGGAVVIQLNDDYLADSIDNVPLKETIVTDLSERNLGVGNTGICIYSTGERCSTCGNWVKRTVMSKDIVLYDYRGVCTSINSAETTAGGTVTIRPTFNKYTTNVSYLIKYAGDSQYYPLIPGSERNSMGVSIGSDYSIVLTNVNKSKGNFDILPVPYDRSGSLPYGFNENTDSHVAHIVIKDTEKPVITQLPNVYDRVNGKVTVEFSATDNEPLPTDCYSFDGGAYSSQKTKTYSTAGKYNISVRDAAGNIAVKEFTITEADILKNDTEKPVITQLPNVYDRVNGKVTVEFTATDNRALPTDCYSFDGWGYSSVKKKTYSVPGKYIISVRDAAGNIATKEFTITEADVLKNDTEKPVITQLPNVYDRIKGTITVSFSATDNRALPTNCYSFDGGTYSSVKSMTYSVAGKHKISVKDAAGNVAIKEFAITQTDVAKPSDKKDTNPSNPGKNEEPDKPYSGEPIKPSNPTNPTNPTNPNDDSKDDITPPGGSSSSSKVSKGIDNPSSKHTSEKEVNVTPINSSSSGYSADGKRITSNKQGNSSSERNASLLSEWGKNSLFENIKANSGKYVMTQEETAKENSKKYANKDSEDAVVEEVIEGENIKDKSSILMDEELLSRAEEIDNYVPHKKRGSVFYVAVISFALLLLVALATFVLFFMVLIFSDTDEELLSGEMKKKLVAMRVVFIHKKYWSLNINELLNMYPSLEAYPGLLFVYLFEGEYIKILSKVKGDEKREIAREEIRRRINIGKGRRKR